MARHRRSRKARRNPRSTRRRRRINTSRIRRRGRRTRRNPEVGTGIFTREHAPGTQAALEKESDTLLGIALEKKKKRSRRRRLSRRQLTLQKKLRSRARSSSSAIRRKYPKGAALSAAAKRRKRARFAQVHRMYALADLAPSKPRQTALYRAMHVRNNPGLAGLWVAAKALAPTVGVGAVSMIGLAMVGKKLSDLLTTTADPAVVATAAAVTPAAVVPSTTASAATAGLGAVRDSFLGDDKQPKAIVKYMPAISTVLVSAAAYWAANKWAPKYKGAVVVGGLLGAVVQALAAATSAPGASSDSLAAKAKAALGLGDYTTVGGRAYAEGGMFREIGDYTTVGAALEARDGGAYSNQRPRRGEMDNATQWAVNGLGDLSPAHFAARRAIVAHGGGAYSNQRPRGADMDNATEWATNGLDDTTEFAPGEGGVLAGGMFRGPSTR